MECPPQRKLRLRVSTWVVAEAARGCRGARWRCRPHVTIIADSGTGRLIRSATQSLLPQRKGRS